MTRRAGYFLERLAAAYPRPRHPVKYSNFTDLDMEISKPQEISICDFYNRINKWEKVVVREIHGPYGILDRIEVVCSHGYLVAELRAMHLPSASCFMLTNSTVPAEIYYEHDDRRLKKQEEWHILGKHLPDFGRVIGGCQSQASVESRLAEYVLLHPSLRESVLIYLRVNLPESSLYASMSIANFLR